MLLSTNCWLSDVSVCVIQHFLLRLLLWAGSDYIQWFTSQVPWKKTEIYISWCSIFQINLLFSVALSLPGPFLPLCSDSLLLRKTPLVIPTLVLSPVVASSHLSSSWLLFNPFLCCLSGFILCHFSQNCGLLFLISTLSLLQVMWETCYLSFEVYSVLCSSSMFYQMNYICDLQQKK